MRDNNQNQNNNNKNQAPKQQPINATYMPVLGGAAQVTNPGLDGSANMPNPAAGAGAMMNNQMATQVMGGDPSQ